MADRVDTTNYQKFQTKNPVVRRMFEAFFAKLANEVEDARPRSLLDAGCGEGESLERLRPVLPDRVAGFDLNQESVDFAAKRLPEYTFSVENIYELPFADNAFDVVMCCEVLEHLDDPGAALRELGRVAKRRLILSVPHEPWFQLGSLARGKYVSTLGNHPEHINHWNPQTFREFLRDNGMQKTRIGTAFPWIVASCR